MKLIERKDIDTKKWDERVASSDLENIFLYSWYLDAVCSNWAALITENYRTIVPVPYTQKLRVKQLIQAPFTREYDIIGDEFDWNKAIEFLSVNFKSIHFRNSEKLLVKNGEKRQHQQLNLKSDFQKSYRTNAKRILKKSHTFSISVEKVPTVLINLFSEHVAHKIETISKNDLISLERLMQTALKNKHGELLLVRYENAIVAGGFFLFDKSRVTYLKGAATDLAKKAGAMYALIDFAMNKYSNDYNTFDFGGSDIDKVAEFYHKFGAVDRTYFDYSIDDLPFWFKALKKIKR